MILFPSEGDGAYGAEQACQECSLSAEWLASLRASGLTVRGVHPRERMMAHAKWLWCEEHASCLLKGGASPGRGPLAPDLVLAACLQALHCQTTRFVVALRLDDPSDADTAVALAHGVQVSLAYSWMPVSLHTAQLPAGTAAAGVAAAAAPAAKQGRADDPRS